MEKVVDAPMSRVMVEWVLVGRLWIFLVLGSVVWVWASLPSSLERRRRLSPGLDGDSFTFLGWSFGRPTLV